MGARRKRVAQAKRPEIYHVPVPRLSDAPTKVATDALRPCFSDILGGGGVPSSPSILPANRTLPSASYAIAAAAFSAATTGVLRRRLKGKGPIALVVRVPGPSWVRPIRDLFTDRFGKEWQAVTSEFIKTSKQRSDRDSEIADDLARGRPVIGIAVEHDTLPTALAYAVDVTIRLQRPSGLTIKRAIRMFTGRRGPSCIEDNIAYGLEFHDLVAAFRAGSSPAEIVERLQKTAAVAGQLDTAERLPKLQDAFEYGLARTWGLALARDIADYRAGNLNWQDIDRGAILYSEPGLGKSLLARILAAACGVPLVAFSIADLFAGSPGYLDSVIKASRAMFERAAALAPCILFLDEIDALPNRATMSPRGADWWTPVVTDFLLSLDNAVAGKRSGIVVCAATNNIRGVDAALLRPGRLERAIEIARPDQRGIINILRYHLNGELIETDLTSVAELMVGFTGADIMMAARSARRIARYANRALECDDLIQAIVGNDHIAAAALGRICAHEAGHAVASVILRSGRLVRCVIGGAAGSGGRTLVANDADDLMTREALERRAIVLLAGRTAERVLIGDSSVGAGGDDDSDLAQVTQLVATLHASVGLGDTLTYLVSHREALAAVRTDHDLRSTVEKHLRALQARTEDFVRRHRDQVLKVADRLCARRQLSGEDIRRLIETNINETGSLSRCDDPS
jgi:cell division protease FtsH